MSSPKSHLPVQYLRRGGLNGNKREREKKQYYSVWYGGRAFATFQSCRLARTISHSFPVEYNMIFSHTFPALPNLMCASHPNLLSYRVPLLPRPCSLSIAPSLSSLKCYDCRLLPLHRPLSLSFSYNFLSQGLTITYYESITWRSLCE